MIDALVRNTSGVTSVNDQLQESFAPTGTYNQPARVYAVPPATQAAPPPPVTVPAPVTSADTAAGTTVQATTQSDRFLAQDIVNSLRSDGLEPIIPRTVSIIVTDGRVDLRGTVESEREHQAIVDCVRRTPGVNIVYDGLQVR
jgi:osmotically-inducible protein OsmY